MAVQILKSISEIDQARVELRRRGVSCIAPWWRRIMHRRGFVKGVNVGDYRKSWDVLKTANFIEQNVSKSDPILDIGAYASELLCVLHRLDYSNLTGVDLNPNLKLMPYSDSIRYEVADYISAPFENESFAAITAISVLEHGFKSQPLLKEIRRLLRPGGYFIASIDYWPDKVDVTDIGIYMMDWRIFSKNELLAFIDEAQTYNLTCGAVELDAQKPVIMFAEKHYTFAWLVLQKAQS